jgi:hypothetical protein
MRPEGITDRPGPPWELPGTIRRDREPHRGPLLRWGARLVTALGVLGVWLVVPALLGLPLGVAVWRAARRDLALMRLGRMDPAGAVDASAAQVDALAGALLPFFGWGLLALLAWLLGLLGVFGGRAPVP